MVNTFADEQYERFNNNAVELVQRKVDVHIAVTVPAALAAQRATKTTPIVFVLATVFRRSAAYVDRILRGAKPDALPTKFEICLLAHVARGPEQVGADLALLEGRDENAVRSRRARLVLRRLRARKELKESKPAQESKKRIVEV